MSEFEPQVKGPEASGEQSGAEQREKLDELMERAKEARNKPEEAQESLRHTIEHESSLGKELKGKITETEKPKVHDNFTLRKETKKMAYKKTLSHVRRHLPKPERAFSKIIHQPVIEKVSDISAKTVARPSGLLAGGICAMFGSAFVLFMSKHYGFRYNFTIFIALLVLGFVLGLLLEMIWSGTQKIRKH